MLSRVADSLYWMARYLERAERSARLLSVQLHLMLDHSSGSEEDRWKRILDSLSITIPKDIPLESGAMIHYLTLDPENPASILSSISAARSNARQLRDHISSEMWSQLNRLHLRLREPGFASILTTDPNDLLRQIIDSITLFNGLTHTTINRGESWQFILIGRYLERASLVSTFTSTHFRTFYKKKEGVGVGENFMEWVGLLKACSAFESFCNHHTADIQPKLVAEYLLLEPEFPQAACFAALAVDEAAHRIVELNDGTHTPTLIRRTGKLSSMLRYAEIDDVLAGDVHAFAASIEAQSDQIHQAVYSSYITFPLENAIAP